MELKEYDYLDKTADLTQHGLVKKKENTNLEDHICIFSCYNQPLLGNMCSDKSRDRSGERGKSRDMSCERGKSRDRSVDRVKWRDRSSERGKSRERSRERGKSRDKSLEREESRDRSRERLDREKKRERERREREKSRDRDREKDQERESRSRSRSCYERERGKELLIERERELELRESRRFKDKKETVEPDAGPERDQRTVFAYQMPLKATERDVYEFFSKAGKVRDVRLIMDRTSRCSKGVGYIEFFDIMSVPMAIALSDQLLFGQPVMVVKPSVAEKNLVQTNGSGGSSIVGPYGVTEKKLYVGNLHFKMTEIQLKQIFEAFGPVELIQLPLDPVTGHCKGSGFVQFSHLEHAKAAQSLNGKLEIAGRTIKVSSVTDHILEQDSGATTADFDDDEGGGLALNAQSRALLIQKLDRSGIASSDVGSIGTPMLNGAATSQLVTSMPIAGTTAIPAPILTPQVPTVMAQEPIGKPSECLLLKNMFDPAIEALNAQSRALIIQKLDRSGIASSVVGSVGTPMLNGAATSQLVTSMPIAGTTAIPAPILTPQVPTVMAQEPIGKPSECLLLKNMFDPAIETDPEFDLDIQEDVYEECSKYGHVKHIHVDKNSAGYVFLRFDSVEGASCAQQVMHKRWFGRRSISAIYLQPYEYDAKFKGAS